MSPFFSVDSVLSPENWKSKKKVQEKCCLEERLEITLFFCLYSLELHVLNNLQPPFPSLWFNGFKANAFDCVLRAEENERQKDCRKPNPKVCKSNVPTGFPSYDYPLRLKLPGTLFWLLTVRRTETQDLHLSVCFFQYTMLSDCWRPMRSKLPWLISSISHFTWRGLVAFSRALNWIRNKPTKRLQTYQEFTLRDCHIFAARYSILFSVHTSLGDHIK